ncbi:MAG: hypothetical protein NWT08_06175 [Akkermansiaceae bacterium]|nr:hypothetical protein [Akkermansiaceae bacterium]MDP4780378.1 hypothetical protein [Akkermansiaceae bacterium]MDP4846711.1 hypothetical protein [Akkermansiaceae bacterium]MDP4995600.1 hypothetical protein [Akkermansiaceae bacterium]
MKWSLLSVLCMVLCQCASSSSGGYGGPPNMGGPTAQERAASISSEASGDFFYGRRYYVKKTRFWGYLRKPRESATKAKLVIFKEDRKYAPDRMSEATSSGYGHDNNYEYKIRGNYTGETAYDPNSNQFLPVFRLSGYELVNRNPGWLFSPSDHYDPFSVTLRP